MAMVRFQSFKQVVSNLLLPLRMNEDEYVLGYTCGHGWKCVWSIHSLTHVFLSFIHENNDPKIPEDKDITIGTEQLWRSNCVSLCYIHSCDIILTQHLEALLPCGELWHWSNWRNSNCIRLMVFLCYKHVFSPSEKKKLKQKQHRIVRRGETYVGNS